MEERESEQAQRFREWALLVDCLVTTLALFAWAGSGAAFHRGTPWIFSKTGWLVAIPSLTWIWLFAATAFILLSRIAWLLFHPLPAARVLRPWFSVTLILTLALAIRIVIAATWHTAAVHWHPILADMLLIAVLMLALHGANRSLWWAALYAFHPLPLIEIAANGHWIAWGALGLVLLIAMSHHISWQVNLIIASAIWGTGLVMYWVLHRAGREIEFNSLGAASSGLLIFAGCPLILGLVFGFLRAGSSWRMGKMMVHPLVVLLICSPVVKPWMALPLLAILPLVWNRAGWVLSIVVLAAYANALMPRQNGQLPLWLLMLEWIPIVVLEAQELLAESLSKIHPATPPSAQTPATVT